MKEITMYNEKENTLYILSDVILPEKPKGQLSREQLKKVMEERREYFKKSYEERIALSSYREEIMKEIEKHPNCKISEYCNAF